MRASPTSPLPTRAIAVALASALVLLGACSSSGGEKPLTVAQLKTIVPAPGEIGSGYAKKKADNSNSKVADAAIKEACPDAVALGATEDTGKKKTEVEQDYATKDGREID